MTEELGKKLVGDSWYGRLKETLHSPEFASLGKFLSSERLNHTIYPKTNDVFKAFIETPFDEVRVIIIGQDPYHGENQATGLAFANPDKQLIPQPSLKYILNEVESDIYGGFNFEFPSFTLEQWSKQGVLLLNTALTVRQGEPGSHIKQWKFFTDSVIGHLNAGHSGLVWLLWSSYAKAYENRINKSSHHILTAGHPASACYGKDLFTGCKHFSKTNELLKSMNNIEIKW